MRRVSMATGDELVSASGQRYIGSGRAEKVRILDEFVAVSGLSPQACNAAASQRFAGGSFGTSTRASYLR